MEFDARIKRVYERGLGEAVGYVLPLASCPPARTAMRIASGSRKGGSSAAATPSSCGRFAPRLPAAPVLAALRAAEHYPYYQPQDPLEERGSLTDGAKPVANGSGVTGVAVRTALAIEPRDGVIRVFMPPVQRVDEYLELAGHLEAVAAELKQPIQSRATSRPSTADRPHQGDPRSGVIEINVHPAASWREAVAITTRALRGGPPDPPRGGKVHDRRAPYRTGGGNHVVLGGVTPDDSPFLRRPDLLKSIVLYWQRHPALSYLFSGLTSVRRARRRASTGPPRRALRELEIALAQVPAPDAPNIPRWLGTAVSQHPDRRHGNTTGRDLHRQALLAGRPDRAPRPSWSSAPSRCRRTRG